MDRTGGGGRLESLNLNIHSSETGLSNLIRYPLCRQRQEVDGDRHGYDIR
jgi:hypothetical protein